MSDKNLIEKEYYLFGLYTTKPGEWNISDLKSLQRRKEVMEIIRQNNKVYCRIIKRRDAIQQGLIKNERH